MKDARTALTALALAVACDGGTRPTPDAALLYAFYPGSEGGTALAEILFGDWAPSGRLPFSVPARAAGLEW